MDRRHSTRSALVIAALFVAIPLLFIAGVAIFQLANNVPDARAARARTVQAFQTVTTAKAVDEAVQDPERGQRGFLITGQETYIETRVPGPAMMPAVAGTETIRLVDDDEIVRETVGAMREEFGLSVIQAPGGAEALAILQNGAEIDLLLTDIVMPGGISGRVLAERAAELKPGLKVLFISGYAENAIVRNGRLDLGVESLSEPYGREQLAARVWRILDRPAQGAPAAPI